MTGLLSLEQKVLEGRPATMSTFRQEAVEDYYEMGEELGRWVVPSVQALGWERGPWGFSGQDLALLSFILLPKKELCIQIPGRGVLAVTPSVPFLWDRHSWAHTVPVPVRGARAEGFCVLCW